MILKIAGKDVTFKDEMLMEDLMSLSFPPGAAMTWLKDQQGKPEMDFSDPRAMDLIKYIVNFLTKMNTSGVNFMKQPVSVLFQLLNSNANEVMNYLSKMLGSLSGEPPKQ